MLAVNEFALIDRFVRCFDVARAPFGPGDDAAVIETRAGLEVVTTDALVEGVHFTRETFSFEDVGHKALAVNLSDVAAMGAWATWFTVALGLPRDVGVREVVALGRGMSRLAEVHGARLVGGNVTSASELSVTITVAGQVRGRGGPLLRSGGREGDLLFVSGPLGDAAGGLLALKRGVRTGALVRAQRRPSPHLAFAHVARGLLTSAIDVSDGLLQDLGHVLKASGVGAELEAGRLPISEALRGFAGERALELALSGGEDYVLLCSAPARHRAALARLGAFEIGRLIAGAGVRLDGKAISPRGWQHR